MVKSNKFLPHIPIVLSPLTTLIGIGEDGVGVPVWLVCPSILKTLDSLEVSTSVSVALPFIWIVLPASSGSILKFWIFNFE